MSGLKPRNEAGQTGNTAHFLGEPDLTQCRAKPAGFGDYVDCLATKPECCRYALRFGDGHLCQHDERHNIAARPKPDQFDAKF